MVQLKPSEFRQEIERYLEDEGWDFVCRRRNEGYNLLWAEDDEPLARFKPVGNQDEVEIFWWNDDCWRPVGEFGCVLPLDEALDFVFEDPEGLFFEEVSSDDEEEDRG